ncbi:MAG: bifunctional riboflavin kinase/FAD synthetase [Beijerinckiaceae bacterium]
MHWGHRYLINRALDLASSLGRPAALLTFEPHPRAFFQADKPFFRLTAPPQKSCLAEVFGLQGMISLTFDAKLAALTAEAFVKDLLVGRLDISGAVVGYDFHFGKNRAGSPEMLASLGLEYGFVTDIITPQSHDGAIVSSTLIRSLLADGNIAKANTMLGHAWTLSGEVMHGDKRGRELGYPTANLVLDKGMALKHGIYAVRAIVDGKIHAAVASFGRRPTFDDGAPRLEVHIFDFSGDLYGKIIDIMFVGYIRPELKFDGIEPLIRQMDEDSRQAREMLTYR